MGSAKTIQHQEAREYFLKGVSMIIQTGGIAAADAPDEIDLFNIPFPKNLSKNQLYHLIDNGIALINKAKEIDPNLKEADYYIGVANLRIQKTDKAILYLKKSIAQEKKRELPYSLVCTLLWEKKKPKDALEIAELYEKQFPNKTLTSNWLIGKSYFEIGQYEEALNYGKKIISENKSDINGNFIVASSLYMLDQFDDADEFFKLIISLDSRYKDYISTLKKDLSKRRNN
jgi:tetratricopeptide (TPR) repeat protein